MVSDVVSSESMDSVCDRPWDVVVIGAGPAGAVAACRSAKSGQRTLLVDRKTFPRPKVCGACINGRALEGFRQAGLEHVVSELDGVPLRRFCVRSSGQAMANIPLSNQTVAIGREELDFALVSAAVDEGVHFLSNVKASVLATDSELVRSVALSSPEREGRVNGSVVIAADGLSSSCLKELPEFKSAVAQRTRIGLGGVVQANDGNSYERGTIYMAVTRRGYVGVVRLHDGRLNIAAAVDSAASKESLTVPALVGEMLTSAGFDEPAGLSDADWGGTTGLTRTLNRVAGHRLLLAGDAGGYVEPFTGEGIAWAVTTGAAAGEFAREAAGDWSSATEGSWSRTHSRLVKRHQFWCHSLAHVLRCPPLVNSSLTLINRFPQIVRPVLRHLNQPPAWPKSVAPKLDGRGLPKVMKETRHGV